MISAGRFRRMQSCSGASTVTRSRPRPGRRSCSTGAAITRHRSASNHSLPGARRVDTPWRNEMSLLIEDLARDRIRQIERDSERARQVREARSARRAAKSAAANR